MTSHSNSNQGDTQKHTGEHKSVCGCYGQSKPFRAIGLCGQSSGHHWKCSFFHFRKLERQLNSLHINIRVSVLDHAKAACHKLQRTMPTSQFHINVVPRLPLISALSLQLLCFTAELRKFIYVMCKIFHSIDLTYAADMASVEHNSLTNSSTYSKTVT